MDTAKRLLDRGPNGEKTLHESLYVFCYNRIGLGLDTYVPMGSLQKKY
jgi:hypothetical protein